MVSRRYVLIDEHVNRDPWLYHAATAWDVCIGERGRPRAVRPLGSSPLAVNIIIDGASESKKAMKEATGSDAANDGVSVDGFPYFVILVFSCFPLVALRVGWAARLCHRSFSQHPRGSRSTVYLPEVR